MIYDLIIIGGGPAGIAGGVYASRKLLKTIFITEEWGGQSIVSENIQNWIGTTTISGADLAKNLETHLRHYAGDVVEIIEKDRATNVLKSAEGFEVTTKAGKTYTAQTVLICSGASRRRLEIPGADQFEHKGLTYCASCDGPLFAGMDTAVIGGGNAAFETAAQLLAYAKSVTLLNRSDAFKADPVTVEKVLAHPNMKAIKNAETTEIKGEQFVTGLTYTDKATGEKHELPANGIFVEIGLIPSTDYIKDIVELDHVGRIKVDPRNQRAQLRTQTPHTTLDARHGESDDEDVLKGTMKESQGTHNDAGEVGGGVWAAGDCTDGLYHQNNIAAGDAVKALEDIYVYLRAK